MSAQVSSLAESVERGAAGAAIRLNRKSPARWSGTIVNGSHHELELQLEDNWLLLTEHARDGLVPPKLETLWSALAQNAAALTEVKTVLTPKKRLALRSDLLLTDDGMAEQRVRGVMGALQGKVEGQLLTPPEPSNDWMVEVERRCEESGWSSVRRSSGRLTVSLETTPVQQATVTPIGAGVRLVVEVADCGASSAACRMAAALLALEASAQIRMVRAAAEESRIRFETVFSVMPGTEELAAGFGGLSVAVALTAEAFRALQNEDLARDYLAIRGWSAAIQNQQPERINT